MLNTSYQDQNPSTHHHPLSHGRCQRYVSQNRSVNQTFSILKHKIIYTHAKQAISAQHMFVCLQYLGSILIASYRRNISIAPPGRSGEPGVCPYIYITIEAKGLTVLLAKSENAPLVYVGPVEYTF